MKAIEKFVQDQIIYHSDNWKKILLGYGLISVNPSEYKVKAKTFQQQANKLGFKTCIQFNGDLIDLYK